MAPERHLDGGSGGLGEALARLTNLGRGDK